MSTITIDRATRDMLCEELRYDLQGAGSDLESGMDVSRQAAEEAIEKARQAFGVRDALGWDAEDRRDLYELTIDGETASWIRTVRDHFAGSSARESDSLARLEAGDDSHQHVGRSMAESVVKQREVVGRWKADLTCVERLVELLDEQIGAVA